MGDREIVIDVIVAELHYNGHETENGSQVKDAADYLKSKGFEVKEIYRLNDNDWHKKMKMLLFGREDISLHEILYGVKKQDDDC